MYPNDQPGLGVDIDEEKAKNLLVGDQVRAFYAAEDRRADGSVVRTLESSPCGLVEANGRSAPPPDAAQHPAVVSGPREHLVA